MIHHWMAAAVLCMAVTAPAQAARVKSPADQNDSVKALIRPGAASRKLETASRATALAFWQAIRTPGAGASQYLAADFVNHAHGLPPGGQGFADALRSHEQALKLPGNRPLFALGTGQLVMIAEGLDARNPQMAFRVNVMRVVNGKISEYWANGG